MTEQKKPTLDDLVLTDPVEIQKLARKQDALRSAFRDLHSVESRIEAIASGPHCDGCGLPFPMSSMTQFGETADGRLASYCPTCFEAQRNGQASNQGVGT